MTANSACALRISRGPWSRTGRASLALTCPRSLLPLMRRHPQMTRSRFAIPMAASLAASPADFGDRVSKWPPAPDEPSYFRLSGVGPDDFLSETYYGLSIALQTAAGPMWITVARAEGSDALIRSLLREFGFNSILVSPLLMLASLSIV